MFDSLCISLFLMQTPPTTTVIRSLLRQHWSAISCKHHLRGVGAQTACKGTLITVSLPCEIIHCTIIYSSVTEDLKHWLWLLKKSLCRKGDVCDWSVLFLMQLYILLRVGLYFMVSLMLSKVAFIWPKIQYNCEIL